MVDSFRSSQRSATAPELRSARCALLALILLPCLVWGQPSADGPPLVADVPGAWQEPEIETEVPEPPVALEEAPEGLPIAPNTGLANAALAPSFVRYEQDDPAWVLTGAWSTVTLARASGGSHARSATAMDTAQLNLSGTWINLGFIADRFSGEVEVLIDGTSQGVFDLYRRVETPISLHFDGLAPGPHLVELVVTGTANPLASNVRVQLDFADSGDGSPLPDGTFEDGDTRLLLSNGWSTVESDLASGGTYLSGASTIWFPFSGDSFSLHTLAYVNGGRVRLFVDGQPLDVIDLYEPVFANAAETRVFSYEGFGPGDHVLTIIGYQYSAYIDRIDTPGTAPFIDPAAPVSGVVRYESDHPGFAFNGVPLSVAPVSWESVGNILSSGASQGELVRSSVADDAIEFVFDSDWLGLGFVQDDWSGQAEISINEAVVETIDLYSRDSRSLSRYYRDLGPGPHSARIRVLGTASPASAGTRVAFDYAEVWDGQPLADGNFEDTDDDRLKFSRSWGRRTSPDASGGSYAVSSGNSLTPGSAWFHFTGDSVSWQGWTRSNYQDVEFLVDGQTIAVKDLFDQNEGTRSFSLDGFGPGLHVLEVRQIRAFVASLDQVTTPAVGTPDPEPVLPPIVRYEEYHPSMSYSGLPAEVMPRTWSSSAVLQASRGRIHSSSTPGDVWRIDFDGQWIALGFRSTGSSGTAEVFIDGASQGIIDTSGGVNQSKSFTYGGLSAGPHLLEVVVQSGTISPDFADVWDGQPVPDGVYDINLEAAPQNLVHLSYRSWWREGFDDYAVDDDFLTPFASSQTNSWFTFTGNSLTVLAYERDGTEIQIAIDGVDQGVFDLSSEAPFRTQPRAIHFNNLGEGPHIVQVYNSAVGGNTSRIDAFESNPEDFATHKPVVEWFDTSAQETLPGGEGTGFLSTIAIGDLEGDGLIELIAPSLNGRLYVYRGNGQDAGRGSPILWSSDIAGPVAEPALADLDGDGTAEIIVSGRDGTFAFRHNGQLLWSNPDVKSYFAGQNLPWGGPTVANIDLDPEPEIVISAIDDALYVLDHLGNVEFSEPLGTDFPTVPVLADLTNDGVLDIVVAEAWTLRVLDYQNGGVEVWARDLPDPIAILGGAGAFGSPAVADLDDDGRPEIIINWGHVVEALQDDGALLWRYETGRADLYRPSPVTVADVTGDGQVDLVTASAISSGFSVFNHLMMVVDAGGSLVWEQNVADRTASASGVAAQDLTGNGAWEIIWNGSQDGFLILNGPDGDRLYNEPFTGSGTVLDYPTLADVDGDGEAEIVTAGANGLFVIGHAGRWADSRPVWNQHNYHINNINNDWSVPFTQENSWETHNTYRTQTPDRDPGCLLDNGVPVPAEFVELSPEPGAVLPSGLPLVISGRALPVAPSQPILSVDVNSVPVDLLDPSGAFFARVELPSGENTLTLRAADRCGVSTIELGLNGGRDAANPWADLADASVLLEARFASTTRDRTDERLLVNVQAFNDGPSVPGPVLMAVGNDIDPSIALINADGFTPQGEPYVVIVPEGETLPAGGLSAARELAFSNGQQRPIDFTPRWIAPVNQPPAFTSIPELRATQGQPWVYPVSTVDGNGDAVTLRLDSAPAGMGIVDSEVRWTPAQVGNFEIVLDADDGRGGVASQGFTVRVSDASFNRPPVFTSSPEVQRPVGAEYVYDAEASDLDGDSLSFALQAAPAGVTVDASSGEVRWPITGPGQHSIVLTVDDGRGGQATQAWTLYVGQPALTQPGPAFSSVPVTFATPGVQYRYVYRVNSPLPAAPTVSLAQGPANMTLDPVSGTLIWVPTGADLGVHVVELLAVDSNGQEARQRFDLQVLPALPNQPPYLTSSPTTSARIGTPYSYQATAIDPEFQPVSFSLSSAPAGMSIDPPTGRVDWLPQAGDPASSSVTVVAEDPLGGQATQTFTLRLRAANVGPVITSMPPTSATVGEFYSVRLRADDADGDPILFRLLEGPPGMTLHPTLGWLHWETIGQSAGVYPIALEATDDWGGRDTLSFDLTLLADIEPPQVSIRQTPNPVCLGEEASVCLDAVDNVGITELSLMIDGDELTLDAARCALWTPMSAGSIPALASVEDPSGLVGQDDSPLTVFDCNDEQAPVVRLISPLPGSRHDVPVPIVVDIEDNTPAQLTWEVTLRKVGSEGEQLLASDSGEVMAGEVAQFDPQLLQAGDYIIEVLGADGSQTGGIQFPLAAGTGQKAGRVAFTQQDMAWQLGAFPLVVGRSYDSLDAGPTFISDSDFGPGWRLAFSAQVEDSANDVLGPAGALGAEPFTNLTRVTVIKPNGERVGFTFDPQSRSFPSVFQYDVVYTPDDGVTDTLRAIDFPDTVWALGPGYANYIIPYNPSLYELETEDGVIYKISEFDGLLEVRDAIGGVVTATEDGWISSWGARVEYQRDAEDRITDIVLFAEDGVTELGRLEYAYDAIGNLVSATDLAGGTRTFEYADADLPHHITALFDPLGRPESRIVFDDQGRQIAHCPGGADPVTLDGCSLLAFDGDVQTQFIFDGRGFESQLFFDDEGQLIQRRDEVEAGLFAEQTWTYDEAGREIEYIDSDGGLMRTEWDEFGNRVRLEEPDGRFTTWEWGDCHREEEWLQRCDALGNCTTQVLDESCRVIRRIDPLGGETVFEYDANGQRTATVDPVGQRIEAEFGPRGNRIRFTDALGGDVLSSYGDLGELISETERDGSRREWTYDDAGQVETETWIGGGSSGISWTHDAANFVDGLSWPDANVDVTYWPNGKVRRMTHTSDSAPDWWIEYSYDANDNVTRLEDSFGGATEYDYDGLNQITEVRQFGPGIATKRAVIETSNTGQPVRMQRYASMDDSLPGPVTELEYACLSCPTTLNQILHTRPDTTVIHELVYERNEIHQITGLNDVDGTHTFVYDGRGWLIEADHPPGFAGGDQQFVWDGAGNWLTRTGAFDAAETATLGYQVGQGGHRLLSDGVHGYQYDERGGLVERSGPSGRIEIERDARGNPTVITEYDAADQVVSTASYLYSSNQQRIRAERDGIVRHYVFDGPNPIIALDDAGEVVWRQLHLRDADRPLALDARGQLSWLLPDHIGSVRHQVDNAGQVLAEFSYDTFGRQLSGPAPTLDDPVRFSGRDFDLPGGLGYFRLRLYDPFIGRFLSTDIVEPWHYRYADNNPINFVDPSGAVTAVEYFLLICDDILGTANTGGGEQAAVKAAFGGQVKKLLKQLAANLIGAAAPCGLSPDTGDDEGN